MLDACRRDLNGNRKDGECRAEGRQCHVVSAQWFAIVDHNSGVLRFLIRFPIGEG
jgi:hypothetical protein